MKFQRSIKYLCTPNFTYFYHDVTRQDINHLINLLHENIGEMDMEMDLNDGRGNSGILNPDESGSSEENYANGLTLKLGPEKRILEVLGVPHKVEEDKIT